MKKFLLLVSIFNLTVITTTNVSVVCVEEAAAEGFNFNNVNQELLQIHKNAIYENIRLKAKYLEKNFPTVVNQQKPYWATCPDWKSSIDNMALLSYWAKNNDKSTHDKIVESFLKQQFLVAQNLQENLNNLKNNKSSTNTMNKYINDAKKSMAALQNGLYAYCTLYYIEHDPTAKKSIKILSEEFLETRRLYESIYLQYCSARELQENYNKKSLEYRIIDKNRAYDELGVSIQNNLLTIQNNRLEIAERLKKNIKDTELINNKLYEFVRNNITTATMETMIKNAMRKDELQIVRWGYENLMPKDEDTQHDFNCYLNQFYVIFNGAQPQGNSNYEFFTAALEKINKKLDGVSKEGLKQIEKNNLQHKPMQNQLNNNKGIGNTSGSSKLRGYGRNNNVASESTQTKYDPTKQIYSSQTDNKYRREYSNQRNPNPETINNTFINRKSGKTVALTNDPCVYDKGKLTAAGKKMVTEISEKLCNSDSFKRYGIKLEVAELYEMIEFSINSHCSNERGLTKKGITALISKIEYFLTEVFPKVVYTINNINSIKITYQEAFDIPFIPDWRLEFSLWNKNTPFVKEYWTDVLNYWGQRYIEQKLKKIEMKEKNYFLEHSSIVKNAFFRACRKGSFSWLYEEFSTDPQQIQPHIDAFIDKCSKEYMKNRNMKLDCTVLNESFLLLGNKVFGDKWLEEPYLDFKENLNTIRQFYRNEVESLINSNPNKPNVYEERMYNFLLNILPKDNSVMTKEQIIDAIKKKVQKNTLSNSNKTRQTKNNTNNMNDMQKDLTKVENGIYETVSKKFQNVDKTLLNRAILKYLAAFNGKNNLSGTQITQEAKSKVKKFFEIDIPRWFIDNAAKEDEFEAYVTYNEVLERINMEQSAFASLPDGLRAGVAFWFANELIWRATEKNIKEISERFSDKIVRNYVEQSLKDSLPKCYSDKNVGINLDENSRCLTPSEIREHLQNEFKKNLQEYENCVSIVNTCRTVAEKLKITSFDKLVNCFNDVGSSLAQKNLIQITNPTGLEFMLQQTAKFFRERIAKIVQEVDKNLSLVTNDTAIKELYDLLREPKENDLLSKNSEEIVDTSKLLEKLKEALDDKFIGEYNNKKIQELLQTYELNDVIKVKKLVPKLYRKWTAYATYLNSAKNIADVDKFWTEHKEDPKFLKIILPEYFDMKEKELLRKHIKSQEMYKEIEEKMKSLCKKALDNRSFTKKENVDFCFENIENSKEFEDLIMSNKLDDERYALAEKILKIAGGWDVLHSRIQWARYNNFFNLFDKYANVVMGVKALKQIDPRSSLFLEIFNKMNKFFLATLNTGVLNDNYALSICCADTVLYDILHERINIDKNNIEQNLVNEIKKEYDERIKKFG